MPKAPAGALVRIYYDGWSNVQPGDALKTPSGRVYVVAEARVQTRGRHVGRQHLACVVADDASTVSGTVYPLHWYPRSKRRC